MINCNFSEIREKKLSGKIILLLIFCDKWISEWVDAETRFLLSRFYILQLPNLSPMSSQIHFSTHFIQKKREMIAP